LQKFSEFWLLIKTTVGKKYYENLFPKNDNTKCFAVGWNV